MRIAFSTGRPAHAVLPANLLVQRGIDVTIFTAAYRSRFQNLASAVDLRWVPQFVASVHFVSGILLPRPLQRADTALYDHLVAMRIASGSKPLNCFWGWASGSLSSARAAHRSGAKFILDRACPHVDAQQAMLRVECDRLGLRYPAEPNWFHERQLAEYEEADVILVPSRYSLSSFPPEMRSKIFVAPLFGRVPVPQMQPPEATDQTTNRIFTFGTVGGQVLRKGFLYLLQAWQQLQLPNARLLLRTDAQLDRSPVLRDLLKKLPNVEVVGYVENMSEFYRRCGTFVFPPFDDGFGMALLKAIAQGLPTIATTHCGAAELFTPNEDLLVVPAQDAESLAIAMQQLYASFDLRLRLHSSALRTLRQIEGNGVYVFYAQAIDRVLHTLKTMPV